jgi:hypothetical protein
VPTLKNTLKSMTYEYQWKSGNKLALIFVTCHEEIELALILWRRLMTEMLMSKASVLVRLGRFFTRNAQALAALP